MASEIEKLKKTRSSYRRSVTKLVGRVNELMKDGLEGLNRRKLKYFQSELTEKQSEMKEADRKVLDDLIENGDDDDVDKEMEDISDYREKVSTALYSIEEAIEELAEEKASSINGSISRESQNTDVSEESASSSSQQTRRVNIKLPKLELKKFGGKIHEFQEFWDGFQSAVHEKEGLADVDKLKYLKSFLAEPASNVIAGIPITDGNYKTAIQLLKRRYGKPEIIQRAHISHLLSIVPVFNEKSVNRLRSFYDQIETHFRGLEAHGVDKATYSSIVVPALMEKLPEAIRCNMIRGSQQSHLTWSLDDMIFELEKELEIRESCLPLKMGEKEEKISRRPYREETFRGGTATSLYVGRDDKKKCVFCLNEHFPEDCAKITDPHERKSILRKYARCFVCLKSGHRSFDCRSKQNCRNCKGKHHVSVCNNINDKHAPAAPLAPKEAPAKQSEPSPFNANATSWVGNTGSGQNVALQTAIGKVKGLKKECKVRVLFDIGSHASFITAEAVSSLGLPPVRRERLGIQAFGSEKAEVKERDVVEINVEALNGTKNVKLHCYVVDDISSISNVHPEMVREIYPHLHNIYFSDVCRNVEVLKIDILIGSDEFWNFQEHEVKRGGPNEPVAVKTVLGWVLSGPLQGKTLNSYENVNVNFLPPTNITLKEDRRIIEDTVNKLWDLDSLGIRQDNEVHEQLLDNISFTGERYSVRLPWKTGHKPLPTNYENSLVRLRSLGKKLRKEPATLDKYNNIINEQIESGVIEQVTDLEPAGQTHYLPHMAVVRDEAETTKVRIVYDASCKDKGTSLNDCLHVGPPLSPLIFDILLRFRENRVALVGDIEKAFLNIEVDPSDRDCLRFLWFKDCKSEESEIIVYRFKRVVFGVNSSPFLLNAVLRHHIRNYETVDPEFVSKLMNNFYVDDLVSGCRDSKEAFAFFEKAKERMNEGGFKLRKWKTNDSALAKAIYESENVMEEKIKQSSVLQDDSTYTKESLGQGNLIDSAHKVLGIKWDNNKDTLEFDLERMIKNAEVEHPTKRGILKTLATLFDPLGIISPISVTGKVLFQELCIQKLGWDDHIPQDKAIEWKSWLDDLRMVKSLSLPRCLYDGSEGEILSCRIHGFGDASKKAYCAVVYLVYETSQGWNTSLLCSKTRVAPLKELSIPRLELLSGRILAVLVDTVCKALSSQIKIDCVRYWLDSKTALHWIFNNGEWKQWVQFRVNEILKLSKSENWGHVGGRDNPADIGSRGVKASQLRENELWWKGPKWLREGKDKWPTVLILDDTEEVKSERKNVTVMEICTQQELGIGQVIDIKRYATLKKLLNVSSWVLRFIANIRAKRGKKDMNFEGLSADEIENAEKHWIKDVQSTLKEDLSFKKTEKQLGIVNIEGIYVCKGRLERSDLDIGSKYPIFLPKDHTFTSLVVEDCHKKVFHCLVQATLTELRTRFWISKGRQFIKKILKKCFICKKLEGKPFHCPPTSAMPEYRVTEAPPFSKIGIDFAGPLYIKDRKSEWNKMYVCLFVCCVSRAIHLELVPDLTAGTFLNSLRRFCARRGTPYIINSDNAKTFKASAKLLRKLYADVRVRDFLNSRRIRWKFNLELSPWQGGHYERMVKSVKRCLRKVLGNSKISSDELHTVLTEVECVLNSRPLTYLYDEVGGEVLTPSHLLTGRRLSTLCSDVPSNCKVDNTQYSLHKRYMYLMRLLSHFWNRWRKEYLTNLRESHRINNCKQVQINTEDIVLVHDEHAKRATWKIGIVEEIIKGQDGHIRGAKVRTVGKGKKEFLNRPVQKLVPLEIACKKCPESKKGKEEQSEVVNERKERIEVDAHRRSSRTAASNARIKTQLMLDP